ncbi:hypothetical protein KY359_04580 [Candidatus Woesearchaeota archaeon]|nr:hypothetical protein [Candidatus Woesearchaeota archaeon]
MSSKRAIDKVDEGWDEFLTDDAPANPTAAPNGTCNLLQQGGIDYFIWWDREKDVGMTDEEYLTMFAALGTTKDEVSMRIGDHIIRCQSCAAAYEKVHDSYEKLERKLRESSSG